MRPRSSSATSDASSIASRIWWVDMTMVEPRARAAVEKLLQYGDGAIVERSERLIEQEQLGLVQEGARDSETLTHAAGEFTRQSVFDAGEADVFERFVRSCDRICDTGQLAEERQVFESREIVVNADAVAEIADAAVDVDLAFRRLRETGENAEQRGLPRPVAAEEGDA